MIDWTGGYASQWHVAIVNRRTWADSGTLEGAIGVSVSKKATSDIPLIDTGQLQLDGVAIESEMWLRIYLTVKAGGAVERFPVATLLFERAGKNTSMRAPVYTASGQSVLKPLEDLVLQRPTYVPRDVNAAAYIGSLVARCTPAPVVVEGSFTLNDNLFYDAGSTYLKVAWDTLTAGDFCMMVDGYGRIYIRPLPDKPALLLDHANAGLLIPSVDVDLSFSGVKNRWYATLDGATAVAVNVSPESRASYASRGRWVDEYDSSPTLVNGESLEAYATRKLAENAVVARRFSYTREFYPDVYPFDMVRASLSAHGLEGDLRVVEQDFTFDKGLTVFETAEMGVVA